MSKRPVIATTEFSATGMECRMTESKPIGKDFNHISTTFHVEHNGSRGDPAGDDIFTCSTWNVRSKIRRGSSRIANAHHLSFRVGGEFQRRWPLPAQCSTWNVPRFRGQLLCEC